MKVKERKEARKLRKEGGMAVGKIAKKLGVSKSSVSLWVRDIELTEEQEVMLEVCNPIRNTQIRGNNGLKEKCRNIREKWQTQGRHKAKTKNSLFAAGCMLYWGEGSKNRNSVVFCNSDPDMVAMFVSFLRKCFDVHDEDIVISVNCFTDIHSIEEIQRFWLDRLSLFPRNLRKAIVNYHSSISKKKRGGKLPYGTCRVVVNRTEIVQQIFGAIKEIAGIQDDKWLD